MRGVVFGLHELEDGLRLLQVPDHDLSVFAGARKDMRNNAVPADRRDSAAFVEVRLAWLEL